MSDTWGTLYLVPTPIGNLEDITLRALRTLGEVSLVLAEDTRTARRLLDHHHIRNRLLSYTEHNHRQRLVAVLDELQRGDVALISEAGMPGINDPGQPLVAAVTAEGCTVTALPGPSAVPVAVVLAGFPIATFTYLGFLPGKSRERRRILQENGWSGHALVAFESPHRLGAALRDVEAVLGDRRLAICRELSKLHEEIFRGSAAEALAHFVQPRGEFTLVVEAGHGEPAGAAKAGMQLERFFNERSSAGDGARDAVAAAVAQLGVSRRAAYAAWQRHDRGGGDHA